MIINFFNLYNLTNDIHSFYLYIIHNFNTIIISTILFEGFLNICNFFSIVSYPYFTIFYMFNF
jgi:hypothetical protein